MLLSAINGAADCGVVPVTPVPSSKPPWPVMARAWASRRVVRGSHLAPEIERA